MVGDVTRRVTAAGAVQPTRQVNVGAQVSGRVTEVLVDFNSIVKEGDVLARIDRRLYAFEIAAQRASLDQQFAAIAVKESAVTAAKAQLDAAQIAFDRTTRLHASDLASQADVDSTCGAYTSAVAMYEAATADLQSAKSLAMAQRAQLDQAFVNDAFTTIRAPVDGVVLMRAIDPGMTVVAAYQTPTLFVIGEDLARVKVIAAVDESNIGALKPSMHADVSVDAFHDENFSGEVTQVRLNPKSDNGVVTYETVVQVENPERKLRPGMSTTVAVPIRQAKDVLKVPAAALRFVPALKRGSDGKLLPKSILPPLAHGEARVYILERDESTGVETTTPVTFYVGESDDRWVEVLDPPSALIAGAQLVIGESDPLARQRR